MHKLWEEKELELEINLAEVTMSGDRGLIEQVVINFFSNAINYTPKGGKIGLELYRNEDQIIMDIWDTGKGIKTSDYSKIFDRFYKADQSRNTPGTGLGLTISQRIVMLHGGTIKVFSELEKGSSFSVRLPEE